VDRNIFGTTDNNGFQSLPAQNTAQAGTSGGTLVVCGSLFLSGEALVALGAFPWEVRTPDMNELTLR
jgi:hypothetical protein